MEAAIPLRAFHVPRWAGVMPLLGVLGGLAIAISNDATTVSVVTLGAFGGFVGLVAAIDFTQLRAPNAIVYPAVLVGLLAAALPGGISFGDALGGVLLAFTLLYVVAVVGRGAMGYGDVKFGAACGAVLGFQGVAPMLAFAFLGGGAVAAVVLLVRVRGRKDVVAFTPFLGIGALAALALLPLSVFN